jgi:hypothetical protein
MPWTMNKTKQVTGTVLLRVLLGSALVAIQCGCWGWGGSYAKHHSVYGSVGLTAHREVFAELHKGDLAKARRVLEAKLRTNPDNPEASYTLGCVDLIQSDDASDARSKRALQAQGWHRVESASGKFYPADELLAHAYLVGRWGKRKNHDLYIKHLHLITDGSGSQGGRVNELELNKRTWMFLSPP